MNSNESTNDHDSEAAFTELLARARPRVAPPADDERIVREAVHAEWQQMTTHRVRQKRIVSCPV